MSPLNVLILSAYPPGVFQYGIEKAFRALGHRVFTAGNRGDMLPELEQALQRYEPGYRYDLLVEADASLAAVLAACPFAPDLILHLESAIPFLPEGLAEAPCPTAAVFSEDLVHADWYGQLFPYVDLALCTWKSTEVNWRAQGHDNVHQWYFGARPTFCTDLGLPRIYDVAFVGNLNPHVQRRRLPAVHKILGLRDEGLRVWVGGGVFFEDYNRIHNQARIVYHRGITDQVNMRVFEAMAAGCLVIMQRPADPADRTTSLFRDREEVVYCDGDEEAVALIRHYARHESERARIAEAGRQKVMRQHNYTDVVRQLIDEILPAAREHRAARPARLARWGKDERRTHLDWSRYYLNFGALAAAHRQLCRVSDYQRDPEALGLLGALFATDGRPDHGAQCLTLAARLDEGAVLPRVTLATLGLSADLPEADAWYAEATRTLGTTDPASTDPAWWEGPYFPAEYERFRLEVSQACFRHPRGGERNRALARLYRFRLEQLMGRRRIEQGRASDALPHVEAALRILPDDGYLHYDRARIHYTAGRLEAAVADLRRAVALEPFFVRAQVDLAHCLDLAGAREEAFAVSWDLVRHTPMAPTVDLWRPAAERALAVGRAEQARELLDEALALAPEDVELRAQVAALQQPLAAQASIVLVADDARAAQRAITTLREHTGDHELLVIRRSGGHGLETFLKITDDTARLLPPAASTAADWAQAAAVATGSHLVFLDPEAEVQPGWLAPLLAAADARTVALPRITAEGHATGPEDTVAATWCLCIARDLWRELGGLAGGDDLETAIADLMARLAARGGVVRVVDDSHVVAASVEPPASAMSMPASAPATTATPAGAPPVSRGLRHVSRPPGQYFDFARPEVAALVPAEARRILDVGCGGGALGALLKQRPGVEVVGIEADPEAAERAATRLDTVLALDLEGLDAVPLPAGAFDCIICADVLEHLIDPERTLAALLPCLAENGTLVASIPNVRHQEVVLDLLVRGRWQYAPAGILDATHLRFYTAAEIAGLLDRLGLQIEVTQANGSEPVPEIASLADVVERLGGDRARFLQESQIIQYIFRARRPAPAARLVAPASPARAQAPAPRKASVVVLAWNELEYTRECVKSVLACTRTPYELILVDNGSSDATLEFFRSVPGAKVVANGANLGFAGGNNRGILAATGDYVVVLNNDTLVTEGWLEGLIAAAEEDPAIGIVGPMSNYVSGPQLVPDAAYGDWPGLQAYAQAFRTRHARRRFDFPRLVGFCMLIKREVISRVGLLDESFGLGNFEDDDYCLRAQQAGFRLVVAGDVFIHHFGSRTFQGQGVDFAAAMRHGQEVFTRKWQGKIAPRLVPAASGHP